jgi:antitoxin component of RelBE/YafQ-DinJ toxin-antitoxin module
MSTKNITLKVNSELYDEYRKLCKEKGLIVSRQFEIFMEDKLRGDN